jgi:hypothetical protein
MRMRVGQSAAAAMNLKSTPESCRFCVYAAHCQFLRKIVAKGPAKRDPPAAAR